MSWNTILLAAGSSKRMCSKLPKVLHKVAGITMLEHAARKCVGASCNIGVISEIIDSDFRDILPHGCHYVIQSEPLGTGHAVRKVIEHLVDNTALSQVFYSNHSTVIICADTPLLHTSLIDAMLETLDRDCKVAIASFLIDDHQKQYARIVGDIKPEVGQIGTVDKIIEYKDAVIDGSHRIGICNAGIMVVDTMLLKELINLIDNRNSSGEFYLTDIVALARQRGIVCRQIMANEASMLGVNSRSELAIAEEIMQNTLRIKHMNAGITLTDYRTAFFDMDVVIGMDTIIGQGVHIEGNTHIGQGVHIDAYTKIKSSSVGDGVIIGSHCAIESSKIEEGSTLESHVILKGGNIIGIGSIVRSFSYIEGLTAKSRVVLGPFLRIREDTHIQDKAKLGSFVEVKNSTIGAGTKANHLAYIGDSDLGDRTNIGAGTIVCNYDGFAKHKTKIGSDVFIGANSCLIAPLTIGDEAIVAGGSIVNKDVPAHALAVARDKQTNLVNGATKYRAAKRKAVVV